MITTEQINLKKETFILVTNFHLRLACSVAVVLWSISKSLAEEDAQPPGSQEAMRLSKGAGNKLSPSKLNPEWPTYSSKLTSY